MERAEFTEPATLTCAGCGVEISDTYYEVNKQVVCPLCRERVMHEQRQGVLLGSFVRAAGLGVVAAVLGTIVWYAVRVARHLEIGLIAIAVGLAVGNAVRKGAGGRGGRAFQILAVVLTYLAIVSANAPAVWMAMRHGFAQAFTEGVARQHPETPAPSADSAAVLAKVDDFMLHNMPPALWLRMGWFVLASPFLAGFQNAIGWLILFFGLQQAWRLTGAPNLVVTGPFSLAGNVRTG